MKVSVTQLDGVSTMSALPLAAGLVVSAAKADPTLAAAEFALVVGNEPPERVVEELDGTDVLGLSLYLWNEQISLEVARRTHRARPDRLVVAGGPAVPTRTEAAADYLRGHPELDVLVLGEGEITFREVLRAHRVGTSLREVAGAVVRDEAGEVHVAPRRPRLTDFSQVGSPFLDGTFDELLARHPLRYPSWLSVALCETNRGCPFTCTFCSSGLAEQNRVNELPLERVRAELDWIAAHRFPHVFVVDLNFGIRRRDAEIAAHLGALRQRTGYPGYCFFYLTKNANQRHLGVVETLRDAGIGCQVALSTQSFDAGELAAVRRANIPVKKWLELRERCDERGIRTYNELILGLPEQTVASFSASLVAALSPLRQDSFYLYLCRVIPNSEMDEPAYRARYGVETRRCLAVPPDPRWASHVPEFEEIVVGTAALPVAEWRRAFAFGYLLSAAYNQRLLHVVIAWLRWGVGADLAAFFHALCDRLDEAAEESALGEMGRVVERFAGSILDGGPALLPVDGAGATNREVADALVVVALRRAADFFAEVEEVAETFLGGEGLSDALRDVFRYQRFVTPTYGDGAVREGRFAYDWPGFMAQRGAERQLGSEPVAVRYAPPDYAGLDFASFAHSYLGAIRAKASTGDVIPGG